MGAALPQAVDQLLDRRRLIPFGLKWAYKLECSHESLRPGRFVLSFDLTIVHETMTKGSMESLTDNKAGTGTRNGQGKMALFGPGSNGGNTRPRKATFTKTPVSSMLVLGVTIPHHHHGDRHGRPSYLLVFAYAIPRRAGRRPARPPL